MPGQEANFVMRIGSKDMPRARQNTAISYFFGSQGQWCSLVFVSTTPMTQEVFSWAGYALQGAKYKERHCGISDTFSQFDFRTKSSVFGRRSFLHLLRILKLWSELKVCQVKNGSYSYFAILVCKKTELHSRFTMLLLFLQHNYFTASN